MATGPIWVIPVALTATSAWVGVFSAKMALFQFGRPIIYDMPMMEPRKAPPPPGVLQGHRVVESLFHETPNLAFYCSRTALCTGIVPI
jgi:hypothetical protein